MPYLAPPVLPAKPALVKPALVKPKLTVAKPALKKVKSEPRKPVSVNKSARISPRISQGVILVGDSRRWSHTRRGGCKTENLERKSLFKNPSSLSQNLPRRLGQRHKRKQGFALIAIRCSMPRLPVQKSAPLWERLISNTHLSGTSDATVSIPARVYVL